jgi:Na+/H+ antiporter NhaC
MSFGYLCLIPPIVVIGMAILTRRAFESLLVGCLVGFVLIKPDAFPNNFIDALKKTLQHEDMVWVILVCGLYGSLIHLIIQSGGVFAFGEYVLRYVKSRRSALVVTWLMGIFIFIDDYMSALATGVTMRRITDNYRVSREMLAFMVNAMAAPICILIPMTTWTIYVGKLLEDNQVVAKGDGFGAYVAMLPYMFSAWIIVIIALLVALGKFPLFRKMRLAEERVQKTGVLAPPHSPKMQDNLSHSDNSKAKPIHFFLPLSILIAATLFLDKDALKGVIVGLVFTAIYYAAVGIMPFKDLTDHIFEGFKSMIVALAILTMSYVLKRVGDEMGLTPYVIASVQPVLSKTFLPMVIFLTLSFIAYSTASSWGLYAVAIPIVVPLAYALGANMYLTLAAVTCAGAFGSQASFYSDVVVLTSNSTECDTVEWVLAQLPYNLISLIGGALMFLLAGFYL